VLTVVAAPPAGLAGAAPDVLTAALGSVTTTASSVLVALPPQPAAERRSVVARPRPATIGFFIELQVIAALRGAISCK